MSYIVAFTGHRPDKLGSYAVVNPIRDQLMAVLGTRLNALAKLHPDIRCISGMALGFDQWAARVCIRLAIPFEAAVPFAGQESKWPFESQEIYRAILDKAAKVHVISPGGFSIRAMQKRNEWMVDRCNLLLAAWNRSSGGTANCVRYAVKIKREWENVYEPNRRLVE